MTGTAAAPSPAHSPVRPAACAALVPAAAARGVLQGMVDGAGVLLADGRPEAARDAALAALAAADRGSDGPTAAYAAAILGHALMQLDDADGAAEAAAVMLARLGPHSDPLWRARALALRAAADVERHRQLDGLNALAEALALVEQGRPGTALHAAASSSVATLLMRLSMYEESADLLSQVARSSGSPVHQLLAVRALVALNLVWSAQLELLGGGPDTGERLTATATCALRMGRLARAAGRHRLARAAVAAEAYALERLGLAELAVARARAALVDEDEPGWVFEWLPGRAALASAAWRAGDVAGARYWVDRLEHDSPIARTGMGRILWEGLVRQALVRVSAPGPGEEHPAHPAVAHLREITVAGARMMWQEREARAADLRQRILRDELARRGEQTARALLVDPLTGLGNRRRLEEALAGGGHRVALFVDVDHFKGINDACGHEVGDEVLRRVARLVASCCRDEDVVVRYGGDEFVVLPAPGDDPSAGDGLAGGRRLAERVLACVRAEDWSPLVGTMTVTVSVGVAAGVEAASALRDSDAAMLAAKRAGRDTLVEL